MWLSGRDFDSRSRDIDHGAAATSNNPSVAITA
jgi:hypothetical protein